MHCGLKSLNMSFDLLVLFKEVNSSIQAVWIEKLKKIGIDAQFPSDYIIGSTDIDEVNIRCKLKPPLVKKATEFQDYPFNLNQSSIEPEVMNDYLESADNDDLKTELSKMKSELQLSSNSGRTGNDLIIQCYLAATLAEVARGILFDPQEFGVVKAKDAYDVAKYHSKNGSKKQNNVIRNETEKIINNVMIKKKKESNKSRIIFLLSLLFVVLLKLITDRN